MTWLHWHISSIGDLERCLLSRDDDDRAIGVACLVRILEECQVPEDLKLALEAHLTQRPVGEPELRRWKVSVGR